MIDLVATELQTAWGLPGRSRWGLSRSLVRGGECGRGSLPSAGRWLRPAPGQWGRGGGGAEGAEIDLIL